MPYIIYFHKSEPQKAVENCCRRNEVPHKCMGICMGGCKETSGGLFPKSLCHKFEKIAGSCCEDPNYSGGQLHMYLLMLS